MKSERSWERLVFDCQQHARFLKRARGVSWVVAVVEAVYLEDIELEKKEELYRDVLSKLGAGWSGRFPSSCRLIANTYGTYSAREQFSTAEPAKGVILPCSANFRCAAGNVPKGVSKEEYFAAVKSFRIRGNYNLFWQIVSWTPNRRPFYIQLIFIKISLQYF